MLCSRRITILQNAPFAMCTSCRVLGSFTVMLCREERSMLLILVIFCLLQVAESFFSTWKSLGLSQSLVPESLSGHPFLILPGFGNDEIDYINPLQQGTEYGLKYCLESKGLKNVDVLPLKRGAWLNVAKGVFRPSFWQGTCKPYDLFDFYLDEVDRKVREMQGESGKPVVLICHSAGGWLARAILSDGEWATGRVVDQLYSSTDSASLVAGLVTLGSPHYPPSLPAMDMTRGALIYVDKEYPGAFLQKGKSQQRVESTSAESIFYITVGGTAVTGNPEAEKGSAQRFAAESYLQVTGNESNEGKEEGDGVVPLSSVHLSGAFSQITLPGVWHSIQAPDNNWYGKPENIDLWLPQAMKALAARERSSGRL